MDISRDEIARYVMEKPLSYDTHSVMVNTVFDKAKGHPRPIFKQGFTGACTYLFAKDVPRDVRNRVLVLSREEMNVAQDDMLDEITVFSNSPT